MFSFSGVQGGEMMEVASEVVPLGRKVEVSMSRARGKDLLEDEEAGGVVRGCEKFVLFGVAIGPLIVFRF